MISSTPKSFLHCSAEYSIAFAFATSNFRARRNLERIWAHDQFCPPTSALSSTQSAIAPISLHIRQSNGEFKNEWILGHRARNNDTSLHRAPAHTQTQTQYIYTSPEQTRIVHPLRDELAIVLNLFLQSIECFLLDRREVT